MQKNKGTAETAEAPKPKAKRVRSAIEGPRSITRTIYFYRADLGNDTNGDPVACRWDMVRDRLRKLSWAQLQVQATSSDPILFGGAASGKADFWVATIRRDGFPLTEALGQLSDLALPDGTGLAELVHVACFDDNIVGCIYNHYGPRMARVAAYFAQVCPAQCTNIRFRPLLRNDAVQRLKGMTEVKLLSIKVRSSYLHVLEELGSSLHGALRAASNATDADEIEIVARPKRGLKNSLNGNLAAWCRRLAGRKDLREGVQRLQLRGRVGDTMQTVDALADEFLQRRVIELKSEKSRALRDDQAYSAIASAYNELKDQLRAAPSIDSSE